MGRCACRRAGTRRRPCGRSRSRAESRREGV
jgi:hypothetical protein